MEHDQAVHASRTVKNRLRLALVAAIALGALAYWVIGTIVIERELVMTNPDEVARVPRLVTYAEDMGSSLYAANCATCHGADMKGNEARGIPNLSDGVWLFDFGRVSDIERTVLYGIRSGHPKSHNVTDMPGLGLQKAIDPGEIRDVIAFMRSLSGDGGRAAGDADSVARGERIFQDKGVCYDCHGRDGTGSSDYGAPNLTDAEWVYGGSDEAVYSSIYDGRHGQCPAFIGKLSFAQIRALSVYIHENSEESPDTPKVEAADTVERGGQG
jgi:cytochrome c oxidase cbb3-type subunit 3